MPWKASSVMEEKVRFVYDYQRDEQTMTELCEAYGIAWQTGYVWLRRYWERGWAGPVELNRTDSTLLSGKRVDLPPVTWVGGKMQLQAGRIPPLTLGSFVLKEPVGIFPSNAAGVLANAPIAGILGTGVLKRFYVIFDWPHQRMLLAPGPDVIMRSPGHARHKRAVSRRGAATGCRNQRVRRARPVVCRAHGAQQQAN